MVRSAFAVFAAALAFGGYGETAGTFAPINSRAFRMHVPGGADFVFARDAEEPEVLHGPSGWTAEIDGGRIIAMDESSRNGFMFFDGRLRLALEDGIERKIDIPPPGDDDGAIAALWPPESARLMAAEAPDIWRDANRLRLWFDNPNKAGLLFAELAIAAFALVFLRGTVFKIAGIALFLASFCGLCFTSSRGGFLAFLCGIAVIIATRIKAVFSRKRLSFALIAVALGIGGVFATGQGERFTKNLFREGARETSRLTIWARVPRMIVDAPGGWGFGESARAYIDWYQPKSECLLKDLISGHLTFLVESGWVTRFLYIFAWFAFGLIALFGAFRGFSPVPIGLLAAFFVAACFNPVLSEWSLCIIPIAAAICALRGIKPRMAALPVSSAFALAICAIIGMASAGSLSKQELPVRKIGEAVVLGAGDPKICVVDDDYAAHGGYWWFEGREIRDWFLADPDAPAVAFARSLEDVSAGIERIALVGEAGRAFLAKPSPAKEVVFISPPFSWKAIGDDILAQCKVSLVAGELVSRLADGGDEPPDWAVRVPGAELYIPGWLDFAVGRRR